MEVGLQNADAAHCNMSQAASAPLAWPPTFPAAAQPDIVRARQKDELFLRVLTDACHDAVRTLLGPRRAMLWSRRGSSAPRDAPVCRGMVRGAER